MKTQIKTFKPRPPDAADGTWRMAQHDVDRVQEFRKCIECFLCQDVCHVLRDHQQARRVHRAAVPRRTPRRSKCTRSTRQTAMPALKDDLGIGYCNITKCCTNVCPEHITITDNAIIPLKERVVDRFYDPVTRASAVCSGEGRGASMFELKPLSKAPSRRRSPRPSGTGC